MLVPHGTPEQEEALLVHTYQRQISGLCRAALKDDGKGDALKGVMEVQLRGANVALQKLAWISWNGSYWYRVFNADDKSREINSIDCNHIYTGINV